MQDKKVTKDIGTLSGKVLVFGGAYSNLQALEALMAIASDLNIPNSNVICTGDVVGYCAQPEEVVKKVMDWNIHCILGNVEIQLREGKQDCGCNFDDGSRCNVFSQQWYPFAKSKLSQSSIDWMWTLPDFLKFSYADLNGFVLHGSYFETAGYIFNSTPWKEKLKNFKTTHADLILAGHSGLPFHQKKENKYWLNAGVIGMPANDANTNVWYMILDQNESEDLIHSHHNFSYDYKMAAQQMRTHHLPQEYALTLETGLWDNCEILPEEETLNQGKKICYISV